MLSNCGESYCRGQEESRRAGQDGVSKIDGFIRVDSKHVELRGFGAECSVMQQVERTTIIRTIEPHTPQTPSTGEQAKNTEQNRVQYKVALFQLLESLHHLLHTP